MHNLICLPVLIICQCWGKLTISLMCLPFVIICQCWGELTISLICLPVFVSAGVKTQSPLYACLYWLFISAPFGLSTDGPRPQLIFHSDHSATARTLQDCVQCGQQLLDLLNNIGVRVSTAEKARRQKLGPAPSTPDGLHFRWEIDEIC